MGQLPWDDSRIALMVQVFGARVASVSPISYVPVSMVHEEVEIDAEPIQ